MPKRSSRRSPRRAAAARPASWPRIDLGGLLLGIGIGAAVSLAAVGSWLAWPGRDRPQPPAIALPMPKPLEPAVAPAPAPPPPAAAAAIPVPPPPAAAVPVALPSAVPAAPHRPAVAGVPPWRRYAVAVPAAPPGVPRIAIVIDDLGPNQRGSQAMIALSAPLTLAFLPYAGDVDRMVELARRGGHEILVHMPMEPVSPTVDPGPGALRVTLRNDELRHRIADGLGRFPGHVGLNNHMGSRFTADARAMSVLMDEVAGRGLLFLDSRTTVDTVAETLARARGIPFVARDVFLDNDQSADRVEAQLAETERVARRKGFAVAIGHPHAATRAALAAWIPQAQRRGFQLVPISSLARTQATAQALR